MVTQPFRVVVVHNDPARTATSLTMGLDAEPAIGDTLHVPWGESVVVVHVISAEGSLPGVVFARQM
jgi:hypothetical protein